MNQGAAGTRISRGHQPSAQCPLLQASGRAGALRTLIHAKQERGPTSFLRLANALTALYPRGSQEKRMLDAMLLVVPK